MLNGQLALYLTPYVTEQPVIRPFMLQGTEPYADDLRTELVEGVGHFIADERPDLVLERALSFFAG